MRDDEREMSGERPSMLFNYFTWTGSRVVGVVARVTNNKTVSLKAETDSHFTFNN